MSQKGHINSPGSFDMAFSTAFAVSVPPSLGTRVRVTDQNSIYRNRTGALAYGLDVFGFWCVRIDGMPIRFRKRRYCPRFTSEQLSLDQRDPPLIYP